VAVRTPGRSSVRLEPLLFGAALLLQLLPLVLLRHLGTQDGPSHLATARVLLDYRDAAHPIYRHFYWIDAFPSPNLATEGLLTGLVAVFRPEVAEKLLAAGYLVLLPLSLRYVLLRAGTDAPDGDAAGTDATGAEPSGRKAVWLAYAGFPLANGFLFASGFSNYCYGVVVFVLAAGWVLRPRRRTGPGYVLALAGWLLLAYVTHFIPAALVALTALVPPLAEAAAATRRRLPTQRAAAAALGPTLVAMVPFAILSLLFLLRPAPGQSRRDNPLALLVQLPLLVKPVVALSYAEYPLAIALGLTIVALTAVVARRRGRRALRGASGHVAVAAGLISLLYLAAPDGTAQGGAINARLALFPPLLALLWLGRESVGAGLATRWRHGAVAVFLLVAVGLAVVRWPVEVRHSHEVDAYVAAAALVRPGSTVLGLQYESANAPRVRGFSDPTLHGADLVAVARAGVDLGHYEAELSYFPTRFRSETNLHRRIDPTLRDLDRTPSRIVTLTDADGRGLVDYVLVRGDLDRVPADGQPAARRIAEQLGAYRQIGVFGTRDGPGTAPLRLYERR
jgi:hypothetical protein